MKPTALNDIVAGLAAVACALTVFVAAALDAPDDAPASRAAPARIEAP